ncbi:ATP-dependent 6-phosphofructokinase [Gracilibacillus sp. YIM 98692]|uniref:6-phosphofructokinase n=1 Tax=Gracilibacillus sp. YIM 98692 TaxID=2663532 RepID=UPI0013D30B88|nr:ATP-dependent 6-phosphofructokinase [Gracilibacillus sp. YIM 98692]
MKKAALITSGGDGAGINSAIEMISRCKGIDLYGFDGGYDGILQHEPIHLTSAYCENRALDGRHIVRTARSKLPYSKEGRDKLHQKLRSDGFEYLIVCGGNGSQKAAQLLNTEGTKTIFLPMTVDNDVNGTDYTIGYDTALNQIFEVLFGLHDTASNMPGRIFMVEVLGGKAGNLALESAVAGACDVAIIPECSTNRNSIASLVQEKLQHKKSVIIMCSESAYEENNYQDGNQGVSFDIAETIQEKTGVRVRKSIMGFYIRAGKPSFRDAHIASRMGGQATKCIQEGVSGVMIGVQGDQVLPIKLDTVIDTANGINPSLLEIANQHQMLVY